MRQSSLVPVPAMPPPVSPRRRADVYLGDSLVTYFGTRELRPNENAGLWLPRHQLDGALSLRISRFFMLRLQGGMGLPLDATVAAPTTLPSPGRVTGWGGVGVILNYAHESGFRLDAELDTLLVVVPSVLQYRVCGADPRGGCSAWSDFADTSDLVPILSGTVRLGWALEPWATVFGGATVRNHPTNLAAFTVGGTSPESSVQMGDPVLIVGLGVDFTVEDTFSIIPHVTWPVLGGPVTYGPMIGLALRGRFGTAPGDDPVDPDTFKSRSRDLWRQPRRIEPPPGVADGGHAAGAAGASRRRRAGHVAAPVVLKAAVLQRRGRTSRGSRARTPSRARSGSSARCPDRRTDPGARPRQRRATIRRAPPG